jgi:uncharacterized protein
MDALAQLYQKLEDTVSFGDTTITDANMRGLFDNYPLHVVARWGDCEAIRLLVDGGARINQRGEHGFTPLNEASASGQFEAAALLVSLGATSERNDWGQLPSESALNGGHEKLAAYLAQLGFYSYVSNLDNRLRM